MASRSNLGGAGGVEFKIDGDATPLENKIAESKAKVEAANASLKLSDKDALDLRKMDAQMEIDKTTEAFLRMQNAGRDAVGPDSPVQGGIKGLNQALSDTVGQVQGLIGKFTIVAGVATGMFALGRAIREHVIEALKDGKDKAKEFNDELTSFKPSDRLADYEKQIEAVTVKMVDAMERARKYEGSLHSDFALDDVAKFQKEIDVLKDSADKERKAVEAKRLADKKITDAEALKEQFEAEVVAMIKRNQAAKELDQKRTEEADREEDKRSREEDARRKERIKAIGEEMKAQEDLNDRVAEYQRRQREAAERTKQAWIESFTAIRTASNEVFGNNRAVSDAGMAGVVESTGTRSAANNRVIFDGGN